jgi:hypothetical protein
VHFFAGSDVESGPDAEALDSMLDDNDINYEILETNETSTHAAHARKVNNTNNVELEIVEHADGSVQVDNGAISSC